MKTKNSTTNQPTTEMQIKCRLRFVGSTFGLLRLPQFHLEDLAEPKRAKIESDIIEELIVSETWWFLVWDRGNF